MHPLSLSLTSTLLVASVGLGVLAGALLAIDLLASRSTFAKSTRRLISRVLSPKVLLAAVLLASLFGSRFLATQLIQTLQANDDQILLDLEDLPVSQCAARTDRGRIA